MTTSRSNSVSARTRARTEGALRLRERRRELAVEQGRRLRAARALAGLSLADIAGRLQLSHQHLGLAERGRIPVTPELAEAFSSQLSAAGVDRSPAWLLALEPA